MNVIKSLYKKELGSYLNSLVALIFLGAFLLFTLFSFFFIEKFFQRGIADVKPLFQWMPLLLIFLVSALTMRSWAEERSQGTLELLLTWPIKIMHLVLGKFLGVMALVALALLLTLPLPITVDMVGDLDWGPVWGGYVGALLAAGAYTAMGLWVSALTRNQIVALIATGFLCGLFFLIGHPIIADNVGSLSLTEVFRGLGTKSRFESIARGVFDIRDVAYYLSLTGLFLSLNVFTILKGRWSYQAHANPKPIHRAMVTGLVLVFLNLVILNLWLAPVSQMRLDLTERHEYTVSKATKNLLRGLNEPLLVRFYSSETHPLLEPLRPQVRDVIKEYGIISKGNVRGEFIDPTQDEEMEREAAQDYGIKPVPIQISERHENKIVSSYFNVLVQYGDQHEVLGVEDLIEINASSMQNIEVKLRNLEYDLTKTIKKVVYGFQGVEELFASLDEPIEAKILVSQKALPESFAAVSETLKKVYDDVASRSGGKLKVEFIVPEETGSKWAPEKLLKEYGVKPVQTNPFNPNPFFMHVLLLQGQSKDVIYPTGDMTESAVRQAFEAHLKRSASGYMKVVGLWTPLPDASAMRNPYGQPPQDNFRLLKEVLSGDYQVKQAMVTEGSLDRDLDILVVAKPQYLNEEDIFAIDQFMMQGGTVIVAAGHYELDTQSQQMAGGGLAVKALPGGLEPWVASHGVRIGSNLVMDIQNEPFPIPITRQVGGFAIRDIQLLRYPFFVDVRPDGMASEHPALTGLPAVTLNWASSLTLDEAAMKEGKVTALMHSSAKSWVTSNENIMPDPKQYPDLGFPPPTVALEPSVLAAVANGPFDSFYKGKASPMTQKLLSQNKDNKGDKSELSSLNRVIEHSPASARLVVIGSGDFIDDKVLRISQSTGQERYLNNLRLIQNIIDWSLEDTDLLAIRSRGIYTRALPTMDAKTKSLFEYGNYGVTLLLLISIGFFLRMKRRSVKPLAITRKPSAEAPAVTEEKAA